MPFSRDKRSASGAARFVAFVLAPTLPLDGWLSELERWSRTSPKFLRQPADHSRHHVAAREETEIAGLIATLGERGIRNLGLEGGEGVDFGPTARRSSRAAALPAAAGTRRTRPMPTLAAATSQVRCWSSADPLRPVGGVSVWRHHRARRGVSPAPSGGGASSIHVYGALRGRAMAGAMGNNGKARVFSSRNEAELIAIDGLSHRGGHGADLRGRPVQCWLNDRVRDRVGLKGSGD